MRALGGVIERDGAEMGVLITMEPPTKDMKAECAISKFYESPLGTRHQRLQVITIQSILSGTTIDMPRGVNVTMKTPSQYNVDFKLQSTLF